jgi:phosphoribosylanthranilate isomerase
MGVGTLRMTKVKICGITNVADAMCTAEAGAHLLGFIFYARSPRYVDVDLARDIIRTVRAAYGDRAPRCVGVFVDSTLEQVKATIGRAELDLAQLHGAESATDVLALHPYAYKALRPRTPDEAAEAYAGYHTAWSGQGPYAPDLLVDAYHPAQKGGTGMRADLDAALWLSRRCRVMLAGGLTPDNVEEAVTAVSPWGVDVSSGVEAERGLKDHGRVRAFVEAVRATDVAMGLEPNPQQAVEAEHGANE